jgi:hypothetical protein
MDWHQMAIDWADLLAVAAATLLGWAGGRRAVRKRVGDVLGSLVVGELAKLLAPVLAPALTKAIRPSLQADMREALEDERAQRMEDLGNALAVHRQVMLEDMRTLLRAEGASRGDLDQVSQRLARVEGRVDSLGQQRPLS